jgi:hypothetical protein
VEGARADFHVVRLEQGATLLVPVGLQSQDDLLECEHLVGFARTGREHGEFAKTPILAGFTEWLEVNRSLF